MLVLSLGQTIKWGPFRCALCTGLFWFFICQPCFGLDRNRKIGQFYHTAWTAKDGAPSQISAIAQTNDGYLWIDSARGLFRFDGVQFELYEPPPGVTLPGHNVYSLLATQDGGLWVSFDPSGIAFLKNGEARIFTPDELPRSETYTLARDIDGRIWAGTDSGLMLFDGFRWEEVGTESIVGSKRVWSLFVDHKGTLWVSAEGTIAYLPRQSEAFQKLEGDFGWVPEFAEAPDGRLWISTSNKCVRPITISGPEEPEIEINARRVIFDRDGSLWMVAEFDGIRRISFPERLGNRKIGNSPPELESFRVSDGLSGNVSGPLFEDREGNIWVGSAKGLDRFRSSKLVPIGLPDGYQLLTLLPGASGDLWVSSAGPNPLLHISSESTIKSSEPTEISCVYRASSSTVWWGAKGGIWRQRNQHFDFFPQPVGQNDWIWEIFGSDDGGIWVGVGDKGIFHFLEDSWTNRSKPPGVPELVPSASFNDANGRTWLGYTGNRVHAIYGAQVQAYTAEDGIDIGRIRVIRGRGPFYWFGGELGLALFLNGRFSNVFTADGGRFSTVSGIVEMPDGGLWLNELSGIIHIPAGEVWRLLNEPGHAVAYQRFDFLDGLPGGPQMEFRSSTAVQTADGRLWFATDNGLAAVDPATMTGNTVPPPVTIRSLSTEDKSFQPLEHLELPKGTENVRIVYNGLSLTIPERVRFKYKLEGVDSDWQDVGTRRQAFYTNLGPGDYQFHVIASNNDGVWNGNGATLAFTIKPAIYQTIWFRMSTFLLALLLLASLVRLLYRRRIAMATERMSLRFEERLAERTRIARDLHDTILQSFVSASMQLDVAMDQLPEDSSVRPRLQRIHELIGQVIDEGRNTVNGLRLSHVDGAASLEHQFSWIREELDNSGQTEFRILVEGPQRALRPAVHEEVYQIGHEAIVNAFRHSGATIIEVEIEYAAKVFKIIIRDNGSGINEEFLTSGRKGHWGLSGMKERAEKIGGRLRVHSGFAAGTEIDFSLPNHIAFENKTRRKPPGWLSNWFRNTKLQNSNEDQGNE